MSNKLYHNSHELDCATINNNNNIRIFRKGTVNTCTEVTRSQELASPSSLGFGVSQSVGGLSAQTRMPLGYRSIKYDLYDNSDPDSDKRRYNLSITALEPNVKIKARCNTEYRFFKRGIEDMLDEPHYQNILQVYDQLNDGTNDWLKIAKCYVNQGTRQRPNMQTVYYQSVILQKKTTGAWFVYHQDEQQLYCCELFTQEQIEFTELQKQTPLIASGWLTGDRAQQNRPRLSIKDLYQEPDDVTEYLI